MHDAFLDSRSKMTSYREFIGTFRELGLKSMTLREIAKAGSFDGMLGLRHDVDHHIERAYLMGRIEADAGAHATYFLLPPGDYDKDENYYGRIVSGAVEHNPEMLALALELTGMGHEIALHNDFLQLSIRTGRPIAELISAEIDWFAKNGIQITGSASHGSTFAARNKISNYEIFAECVRAQNSGRSIPAGKKQFPLNSISMKQLGLEYEAYFIGKSFYISDSGGAVTWPRLNESGTEETFHMEQVDCQAIAGDFKRSPHKGVQALFHADHWQFSDAQAGNEPSLDRLHTARRMARAQGWRSPRARPATLPLGYLESLLSGLSENPRIRLHHFGNVEIDPPCEGEDPRARCAREYTAWAESLTEGRRDASQIHIFVQFNTDSAPGAVDEVLEMQRRLGIPYSLLTFARWTSHSAGREETYPLNWTAIAEDVEQDIASVGYLHNGLHLSRGDIQQAAGDMDADIATLKALGCDIRVFQPWGSNMPSSDMVHTVHVDWWKMTKSQPLWIYNRFGLSFDATFSDASLANPASATIELDPVHWCKEKLKPGHRYLLMLHPHLYETNWDKPAVIEGPEWYQKICKARSMAGWNKLTSRVRKL